MRHFFQSTYAALANTAPVGGWPSFQLLTSDVSFGALPLDSRELYDRIEAVKAMFPKGGGPIPPGKGPDPASDLTQAYLFLQPLTTPAKGQSYDNTPPPARPAVRLPPGRLAPRAPPCRCSASSGSSTSSSSPARAGCRAAVAVSVVPSWKPKLGRRAAHDTNVKPVTMTNAAEWIPAHRPSDPEIASGFLRFSDPDYAVVEIDLDGATLKAFNFVQGIQHANTEMRTADTPTRYGVPSLRSAGLPWPRPAMPFRCTRTGRTTTVSTPPSRRPRPDRSRSTSRTSHRATGSTSGQRRGVDGSSSAPEQGPRTPGSGGYGIGSPPTVVPVPAGDEGWVEPATTQSASSGGSPNPPVYVPEYLMRWAGWSLAGARPGKHLSDVPSDGLEPDAGEPGQRQPSAPDRLRGRRRARCRRSVSEAPTGSGHAPSTSPATASRSPRLAASHGPRRK